MPRFGPRVDHNLREILFLISQTMSSPKPARATVIARQGVEPVRYPQPLNRRTKPTSRGLRRLRLAQLDFTTRTAELEPVAVSADR